MVLALNWEKLSAQSPPAQAASCVTVAQQSRITSYHLITSFNSRSLGVQARLCQYGLVGFLEYTCHLFVFPFSCLLSF